MIKVYKFGGAILNNTYGFQQLAKIISKDKWIDIGTPEKLLMASIFIHDIQKEKHKKRKCYRCL